jgi:hypothetical protein
VSRAQLLVGKPFDDALSTDSGILKVYDLMGYCGDPPYTPGYANGVTRNNYYTPVTRISQIMQRSLTTLINCNEP